MRLPHAGMSRSKKAAEPVDDLASHLQMITEVFVAHGATDKQLAGEVLHPRSLRSIPDGQRPALTFSPWFGMAVMPLDAC